MMPGMFAGGASGFSPWLTVSELPMEGPDGSTTFTDLTGKTWSLTGAVEIDTSEFAVGTSSALFGGGYLDCSHADFSFGTGDWRFRSYVRFQPTSSNDVVFSMKSNWLVYRGSDDRMRVFDGSTNIILAPGTTPSNTWGILEVRRESGVVYMEWQGSLLGSSSDVTDFNTTNLRLGEQTTTGAPLAGWLDQVEFARK